MKKNDANGSLGFEGGKARLSMFETIKFRILLAQGSLPMCFLILFGPAAPFLIFKICLCPEAHFLFVSY